MRRNVPSGNRMAFNNSPGRPLFTDHLKNIDLELELLKRKREMLEQQTQIFETPQYNQAAFSSGRPFESQYEPKSFSSNRDYSRMYDDAPYQQSRKRPAESPWEHDAPIKMFVGKNERKNVTSSFGGRLGPKVAARPRTGPTRTFSAPSSKPSIGQRIASQKQPFKPPPKNFAPTKVTKPVPKASRPAPERAILVTGAPSSDKDDLILREDSVPSQQMTGRLELALGAIMKEIKEVYGNKAPYDSAFQAPTLQRVMKQAIRERIRSIMLGKVVGTGAEIQRLYRQEHPKKTDIDIVKLAMSSSGGQRDEKKSIPFVESEDPVEFYKINMCKLMNIRLKALFAKVKEHYDKGDFPLRPKSSEELDEDFTYESLVGSESEQPQDAEQSLKDLKTNLAEKVMPGLLQKYTPVILELLAKDHVFQKLKGAISRKADNKSDRLKHAKNPPAEKVFLPHFVKIIARPTLPKKHVMRHFLDKFNCRSIKKHRTVRNLLFIGFAEKENYDSILAATGTVVENSTLEILPSERNAQKDNEGTEKENAENGENDENTENDETKEEISAELDGEIDDLLSSIRDADDEPENGEVEMKGEDDAENKTDENVAEDVENGENVTDEGTAEENGANTEETSETVQNEETQENTDDVDIIDDDTTAAEDNTTANNDTDVQIVESATEETAAEIDDDIQEIKDDSEETVEIKDEDDNATIAETDTEPSKETKPAEKEAEEKLDKVAELKSEVKETGKGTPTRVTRSTVSTPSSIRTRRSSKLGQ